MAEEDQQDSVTRKSKDRGRGPDRREVDRRRGGRKANKLFQTDTAIAAVIGVIILITVVMIFQNSRISWYEYLDQRLSGSHNSVQMARSTYSNFRANRGASHREGQASPGSRS